MRQPIKLLYQLLLIFIISVFTTSFSFADEFDLNVSLNQLIKKNYQIKTDAIVAITESQHPKTERILNQLLKGKLYYRKSDKTVFFFSKLEDGYQFENVITGVELTLPKKRGYKKITINNKLRILLRQSIAGIALQSDNVADRKKVVEQMLKKLDENKIKIISKFVEAEQDESVKELMNLAMLISRLDSDDEQQVILAIRQLSDNLQPIVRNKLVELSENSENDVIKNAAKLSLKSIRSSISFYEGLETLYFGLSLGSVLVLAGIGLAITFGVMGVINMAHGELIMIGAYTTYVVQLLMPNSIGMSILVAIPAAFIVTGLIGILMERTVIRHLYGRPLETLLATFGISLILQQAVRSIFSPLNRTVITPEWMSGTLDINAVLSITWNRFYIIIFCFMVFFALLMVMKKTALGLQVRAVSQNRAMARAMGVRSSRVDALTFGLGSGIAGIAGVALSLLTNVGPNLGQAYIIDSFLVVVFGGVGNLWGTLVAGMSLGVANKLLEPWSGAVLAKILVLIAIILFIQKRPRGLFPQRGRAADN